MSKGRMLILISVLAVIALFTGAVVAEATQTQLSTRGLRRLTAEQIAAIKEKILEMRRSGASLQDIKAAVTEMLHGWGVELPILQRQRLHNMFARIRQWLRLHINQNRLK